MTDDYHTTETQPDRMWFPMEDNRIYEVALHTQVLNLNLPKTSRPNYQLKVIIRDRELI